MATTVEPLLVDVTCDNFSKFVSVETSRKFKKYPANSQWACPNLENIAEVKFRSWKQEMFLN